MKTHETCPDCGGHGCLTVFDNGVTYCHQCPSHKATKKQKGFALDQEDLRFEYRGYRGIPKELTEKYNVLTGVNPVGEEVSRVYPYPHRPKVRILPKDFSQNKGFTNDHLLGMDFFNAGSSKKITIVEGEDDWLAAIHMLGDKWPVVALPGANTVKNVLKNKKCYDYLASFEKIIIATDGDTAGEQSANGILKAFPTNSYRVQLTKYKDACDFLENKAASDFTYAWVNAQKYTPPNVRNTPEQFLSLYKDTPEYTFEPTGIEALDEKILGLMQGHFTVIKAPTGIGKTEFMRFLEYQMLKRGVPIASWHLEETELRTLLGLVSYEQQDNVTRRDIITEKDKDDVVQESIKALTKDENFFSFTLDEHEGADELCEQIRMFSEVHGVRYVFFEPIQDVITNSTEEGKEAALANLSVRLSKLAAKLGVGIVTIAHTNDQGDPKYCKMIGQRASVIINLSRDKQSPDADEANTLHITVEKNRPTSIEGPAGAMQFDLQSFTLKEKLLPF